MRMDEQRVEGTIRFCNAVSGTGKITIAGADERDIFFNPQWLPGEQSLFKAVVPGRRVSFRIEQSPARRGSPSDGWQAKDIQLIDGTGIEHDNTAPMLKIEAANGMVALRVDTLGRVVVLDEQGQKTVPVKPQTSAPRYVRAYYAGVHAKGAFTGFNLSLPAPTAERAVILADYQKNPRREQAEAYEGVRPQSYLVVAEADGTVTVYTIGFRHQALLAGRHSLGSDSKEQVHIWVVIHDRFRVKYEPAGGFTEAALRAQTTSAGMRRDNDGFIPAIAVAFQRMEEAKAETVGA